MSELVGGACGWTLALDSVYHVAQHLQFDTGSWFEVRLSVLGAVGAARRSESDWNRDRNRDWPTVSSFRCRSAFPVCYLISVLGAARRWNEMFVGCAGS